MSVDDNLDITKLRYVLYARRSRSDEYGQVRSIPDQIEACVNYAKRLGITLIEPPLEESRSAKRPNNRPIFSQMLKDLKTGKYEGILAWHPDRLARNMLEAGQIIDMIDEGTLKDLRFVTQHFSSDANGKMLLGMAFVLSKQYSDKLSTDVTRGVNKRFKEGKVPTRKHGYINKDGVFRPDGNNFDLICEAWDMRAKEYSLKEIAKYMNNQGYYSETKSGTKYEMSDKILSGTVFPDPFYYGILVQSNQEVDLRELYDFVPATTEEIYFKVQDISKKRTAPFHTKKKLAFYPLKQMIECEYCDRHMLVAPSSGRTKRYLYMRCDNEYCLRNSKENKAKPKPERIKASVRSKIVFDFIYDFLETKFKLTKKEYDLYYNNITKLNDEKRIKVKTEIHQLEGKLKHTKRRIKEISLGVIKPGLSKTVIKENEKELVKVEVEKKELRNNIKKLKAKLTDPEKDKLTLKQFLNLVKNASKKVKYGSAIEKDKVCRIIFLNLTVGDQKVTNYRLKEPFATLLNGGEPPTSRGAGN